MVIGIVCTVAFASVAAAVELSKLSRTVSETLKFPEAVGVPLIVRVVALKLSPGGSVLVLAE